MRSGSSGGGGGWPRALVVLLVVLLVQAALFASADAGGLSVVVAGAALAVCLLVAARCAPAVPPTRVRTALRDRERRTAFLPQRDPDAAGRRRPRAPGRALPASVA
ncbi:DUF6412 domain-containing protein [Streptomyces griseoviridis]|uniref:Uncharacterized protein n=2 Tax=Streptomyces TaxID=1883 RepID=A0A918G335_STRGD|nr:MULTISPECIES: DUF6412 domain-containing protein [Streptomyces]GGS16842.1 hypothetical protein GCM10010238_00840 [Streptomyces niveoruber]GGU35271.1 hypothetical protein GCM10010259_27220 [Streptomyces daghestanicus]GHI33989.1 hypothetical protein Sdagh_57190 [Streptomyces daghestanicus]